MTNKRFTNEELMDEIVKLRTLILEKRDSMDGVIELFEDLLSDYEEDARCRLSSLNQLIDEEMGLGGDQQLLEDLFEERDYMEMMLYEVTKYSGDTDGDF